MNDFDRAQRILKEDGLKEFVIRSIQAAKRRSQKKYWSFQEVRPLEVGSTNINIGYATEQERGQVWTYEQTEREVAEVFIGNIREEDVVFDIGANLGIYSIASAKLNATTVAFEPHPGNMSTLQKNISLNNCSVTTEQMAISDTIGKMNIIGDPDNPAEGSAVLSSEASGEGSIKVPVTTGDRYCEKHGDLDPTVLKIDIEGGEASAIRGFGEKLNDTIRLIVVEVHKDSNSGHSIENFGMTAEQFEEYLMNKGFDLEVIAERDGQYHLLANRENP